MIRSWHHSAHMVSEQIVKIAQLMHGVQEGIALGHFLVIGHQVREVLRLSAVQNQRSSVVHTGMIAEA